MQLAAQGIGSRNQVKLSFVPKVLSYNSLVFMLPMKQTWWLIQASMRNTSLEEIFFIFNCWLISWVNPFISNDRLWNFIWFPTLFFHCSVTERHFGLWLVCSTLIWAVQFEALAGDIKTGILSRGSRNILDQLLHAI